MDDTWSQDFLVGELDEDPDAKTVSVDLKLKVNAEQEEMEGALEEKAEYRISLESSSKNMAEYSMVLMIFEVDYLVGQNIGLC